MQDDDERAPSPLINQYEKFPEYIEIELKPQASAANYLPLLTEYNKYALTNILD